MRLRRKTEGRQFAAFFWNTWINHHDRGHDRFQYFCIRLNDLNCVITSVLAERETIAETIGVNEIQVRIVISGNGCSCAVTVNPPARNVSSTS